MWRVLRTAYFGISWCVVRGERLTVENAEDAGGVWMGFLCGGVVSRGAWGGRLGDGARPVPLRGDPQAVAAGQGRQPVGRHVRDHIRCAQCMAQCRPCH